MKFENLIWTLIFLVYIIYAILKKLRAASKTGKEAAKKKAPGLKEKLEQIMTQLQQTSGEEDTLEDLEIVQQEIAQQPMPEAVEKPPPPKPKPVVRKTHTQTPKPAVSPEERPIYDLEPGIRELRKAVVWSEILGPPVALRRK